jgi:hypothetical protein
LHYQRLGGRGAGFGVFLEAEGQVEAARDAIGAPVSANRDRRSGRLSCSLSSATTPLTSFLSETVRAFAQMVSPRERFPSDSPRKVTLEKPAGTLYRMDENLVLSLFEHPTLIQISDGAVVAEWPHLATGKQRSSIIHHLERIPPAVVHPTERMFAVASEDGITVVRVK